MEFCHSVSPSSSPLRKQWSPLSIEFAKKCCSEVDVFVARFHQLLATRPPHSNSNVNGKLRGYIATAQKRIEITKQFIANYRSHPRSELFEDALTKLETVVERAFIDDFVCMPNLSPQRRASPSPTRLKLPRKEWEQETDLPTTKFWNGSTRQTTAEAHIHDLNGSTTVSPRQPLSARERGLTPRRPRLHTTSACDSDLSLSPVRSRTPQPEAAADTPAPTRVSQGQDSQSTNNDAILSLHEVHMEEYAHRAAIEAARADYIASMALDFSGVLLDDISGAPPPKRPGTASITIGLQEAVMLCVFTVCVHMWVAMKFY